YLVAYLLAAAEFDFAALSLRGAQLTDAARHSMLLFLPASCSTDRLLSWKPTRSRAESAWRCGQTSQLAPSLSAYFYTSNHNALPIVRRRRTKRCSPPLAEAMRTFDFVKPVLQVCHARPASGD